LDRARLAFKTRLFTAIVVLSSVLGNFFLAFGMRRVGRLEILSPAAYILALFDPWVALGVLLLIVWMLAHMALVSWADLSYVLPVTAIGYVLTALAGWAFLGERIAVPRTAGIALIVTGVVLVGATPASTFGTGGRE
jgi:uncharacterized membrane protein